MLEKEAHQALAVHVVLGVVGIAEQSRQHRLVGVVLRLVGVEHHPRPLRELHGVELFVGLVHVVHVVFRRVVGDAQPRVLDEKLLQLVLHRQDAANDHRTLGVDAHISGEHLRKSLVHASRYLAVLFGAQGRQFARALPALLAYLSHAAEHVVA